jgi:hypothetical protein
MPRVSKTLRRVARVSPVLIALTVGACTGATNVPAPTAPTTVAIPLPAAHSYQSLSVFVSNAIEDVIGATVQLLDGPGAGTTAVTDSTGYATFQVAGSVPSDIKLRVSADGYVTDEESVPVCCTGPAAGSARVDFLVHPVHPLALAPGSYTLTITSNNGCADMPAAVQTVDLAATVAQPNAPPRADGYIVTLDDFPRQGILVSVTDREASVEIDLPVLALNLPTGYEEVAGAGQTTSDVSSVSILSMPFSYSFRFNGVQCVGQGGRLTLARR